MKRKNKPSLFKKIRKLLPLAIAGMATIYLGLFIKDIEVPTVLPVNEVVIIGALNFTDKAEIKSIVKNNMIGGYFTLDLNSIRDSLIALPWINSVSLRRQWPATLDVIISEQIPVAYWNKDGYINASGEVFKPKEISRKLNLPELNGPDGYQNNVWKFMNMLYQEMALLEFEVVRLNLDERRSWRMAVTEYQKTDEADVESTLIDVKLGRFETEKRLKRFIRILPSLAAGQHLNGNNIKVIDMRYPNGFSVQRNDRQQEEV